MKKQDNKNLPIYIILAIIFSFQVLMFVIFKQVRDIDMEYSNSHTREYITILNRINKLEEKLKLHYDAQTNNYTENATEN